MSQNAPQSNLAQDTLLKWINTQIPQSFELGKMLAAAVVEVQTIVKADRVLVFWLYPQGSSRVVAEVVQEDIFPSLLGKKFLTDQILFLAQKFVYEQLRQRIHKIKPQPVEWQAVSHPVLEELGDFPSLVMALTPNLKFELQLDQNQIGGLLVVHHVDRRCLSASELEAVQRVVEQTWLAIAQFAMRHKIEAETERATDMQQLMAQAAALRCSLEQTQAQLIHHKKLSSLGQLMAGVAHEINNPTNFIYGNLHHAITYTENLLQLIALYQKQCPQPSGEVKALLEAIDFEFLTSDFPKLLASMENGANRIQQIVQSLRHFSRYDAVEKRAVNLHDGIDSTLMILQHRLKANGKHPKIQVVKNYGDLPLVECRAGEINQVLMNLISNAIDAIEELQQVLGDWLPQITIRTTTQTEQATLYAIIEILDNGIGMTETTKANLFEPFFTTKPSDKGTGLGLSISHQIVVANHNGILEWISHRGQGSLFRIKLPVSAPTYNWLDPSPTDKPASPG
ncbi:GAF domain-containing sensor histidine kinase [Phormidium tenue FACHB-886]|nr:GAF domain-containing sensor histidine kinase [Phormidium tenue FACHB-886]